jgi:hypothetical protein
MLKKQANEIKELNALNGLSATLATNYEHLLCKLKLLSKECDELKSKLESKETKTSNSFEFDESSIVTTRPGKYRTIAETNQLWSLGNTKVSSCR